MSSACARVLPPPLVRCTKGGAGKALGRRAKKTTTMKALTMRTTTRVTTAATPTDGTLTVMASGSRGGRVAVAVASYDSYLTQGEHLATNPTVGIGARQMPPGRVCGPAWSRAGGARIPPILAFRVGENGLMKGTPGNTSMAF